MTNNSVMSTYRYMHIHVYVNVLIPRLSPLAIILTFELTRKSHAMTKKSHLSQLYMSTYVLLYRNCVQWGTPKLSNIGVCVCVLCVQGITSLSAMVEFGNAYRRRQLEVCVCVKLSNIGGVLCVPGITSLSVMVELWHTTKCIRKKSHLKMYVYIHVHVHKYTPTLYIAIVHTA